MYLSRKLAPAMLSERRQVLGLDLAVHIVAGSAAIKDGTLEVGTSNRCALDGFYQVGDKSYQVRWVFDFSPLVCSYLILGF